MNPYTVLGIQPGATLDQVKRAFRRLAMQFHPDRNPRGLEKMKEVNAAYHAILNEPVTIRVPASRRPRDNQRKKASTKVAVHNKNAAHKPEGRESKWKREWEWIVRNRAAVGCHCSPVAPCSCGVGEPLWNDKQRIAVLELRLGMRTRIDINDVSQVSHSF